MVGPDLVFSPSLFSCTREVLEEVMLDGYLQGQTLKRKASDRTDVLPFAMPCCPRCCFNSKWLTTNGSYRHAVFSQVGVLTTQPAGGSVLQSLC